MNKVKLRVGYSPFVQPHGGMGCFNQIFNESVNLLYEESLKKVDAVLLWGGADISPMLYAEKPVASSGYGPAEPSQRDLFELELCRQATSDGKPIIGVCRGAQFICAFAGGKLVQDVRGHGSEHSCTTYTGDKFNVTSSHHQMMFPRDANHELLAWSSKRQGEHYLGIDAKDVTWLETWGEPEVVYFPDVNGMAIQCHPEWHNPSDLFNSWIMDQIRMYQFGEAVVV